jgi:F1F0 ATPase subunit 2
VSHTAALAFALLSGLFLGAIFFGGLWWTVRRALLSAAPALWFSGSSLFRTAFALVGFYVVSNGMWQRLLACLLGFVLARVVLRRVALAPGARPKTLIEVSS